MKGATRQAMRRHREFLWLMGVLAMIAVAASLAGRHPRGVVAAVDWGKPFNVHGVMLGMEGLAADTCLGVSTQRTDGRLGYQGVIVAYGKSGRVDEITSLPRWSVGVSLSQGYDDVCRYEDRGVDVLGRLGKPDVEEPCLSGWKTRWYYRANCTLQLTTASGDTHVMAITLTPAKRRRR